MGSALSRGGKVRDSVDEKPGFITSRQINTGPPAEAGHESV